MSTLLRSHCYASQAQDQAASERRALSENFTRDSQAKDADVASLQEELQAKKRELEAMRAEMLDLQQSNEEV